MEGISTPVVTPRASEEMSNSLTAANHTKEELKPSIVANIKIKEEKCEEDSDQDEFYVLPDKPSSTDFLDEDDSLNQNTDVSNISETAIVDLGSTIPAFAASVETKGEWSDAETGFLLRKYAEYLPQVGPMKLFRSKRQLWEKISKDLIGEGFHKTSTQCENRNKTILKRKKKIDSHDSHNKSSGNNPCSLVPFEEEMESIKAMDDTVLPSLIIGPGVASSSTTVSPADEPVRKKKRRDIDILIELAEQRERNREKRHQEKMELLRRFLMQLQGNISPGTSGGSSSSY